MAQVTICDTCDRAYAKPDPDGCGFHRKEHERVYAEAIVKPNNYLTKVETNMEGLIVVTKCDLYVRGNIRMRTPRGKYSMKDKQEMYRLYQAGVNREQIAKQFGIPSAEGMRGILYHSGLLKKERRNKKR